MECLHCQKPITRAARGRPQRFCCDAHRKAHSRLNGQKDASPVRPSAGDTGLPKERLRGSRHLLHDSPPVARADSLDRKDFVWCGLDLHFGKRRSPVLTLVADDTYPHLFRIRYPDGWTSTPANITRAKDAAYGHARWLLAERKPLARAA
jgi:hypothetical protein